MAISKQHEKYEAQLEVSSLRSLFKYMTIKAEMDNGEPYFHRNVMQKIEVTKVTETFNERAKNKSHREDKVSNKNKTTLKSFLMKV